MKNKWVVWVGIAFSFTSMPLFSQNESLSLKKVNQVDFSHISIKDNFWHPRNQYQGSLYPTLQGYRP